MENKSVTSIESFHGLMNENTVAIFNVKENYHSQGRVSVNTNTVYVCRLDPWPEYIALIVNIETGDILFDDYQASDGDIEMWLESHGVAKIVNIDTIEKKHVKEWVLNQSRM